MLKTSILKYKTATRQRGLQATRTQLSGPTPTFSAQIAGTDRGYTSNEAGLAKMPPGPSWDRFADCRPRPTLFREWEQFPHPDP